MKRLVYLGLVILLAGAAAQAAPVKTAEEIPVSLETAHPYGLVDADVPRLAWSETLHHPDATHIQPHFTQFELAEGDYVIVRSPDGGQSFRYEGLGRGNLGLDPGGFWSRRVMGDTAVVELYTQHAQGERGFTIDSFFRGYTETELVDNNPDIDIPPAICGGDDSQWAKCYETTEPEIYQEARAVARLHLPGSACTGWLVGCEGHLMTNNHCIGNAVGRANTSSTSSWARAPPAPPSASRAGLPGSDRGHRGDADPDQRARWTTRC